MRENTRKRICYKLDLFLLNVRKIWERANAFRLILFRVRQHSFSFIPNKTIFMKTRLPLSLLALVLSAGFFSVAATALPLPGDNGSTVTFRTTTVYQLTEDFSYTKNISFVENSNVIGNKELKFAGDGGGLHSLSFSVPLASGGGNSGAYIKGSDMTLTFDTGLSDVLFSHGRGFKDAGGQAVGGAVFLEMHSRFSFSNQGNVNFYNNSAVSSNNSVYGGAIYLGPFANGVSSFTNTGDVNFVGNAAMGTYSTGSSSGGGSLGGIFAAGGAITVQGGAGAGVGDLIFEGTGAVRFLDNKSSLTSVSDDISGYATVYAGAIHVYSDSSVIFRNTGQVQFVNNSTSLNVFSAKGASARGGAVEMAFSPELLIDNAKGAVFVANSSSSENGMGESTVAGGGALHLTQTDMTFRNMPGEKVVFLKNEVSAKGRSGSTVADGGAIVAIASHVMFARVGDIHFENNSAAALTIGEGSADSNDSTALGGALYLENAYLTFQDTGDIYFMNNSATSGSDMGESTAQGGALYVKESTLFFDAGKGNIVFRGNTVSSDDGRTTTANAIHFDETSTGVNVLIINTAVGKNVQFYDPITS